MTTNTKPSTAELLDKVEAELRAITRHDIERLPNDEGIYVNFDFNVALEVTVDEGDYEGCYALVLWAWAPDHGVEQEDFVGLVVDAKLAAKLAVDYIKSVERD
jgi:hypothetical protein